MKDISKDIIAKIKTGHLIPVSRFRLVWRSYASWLLMLGMIVAGALAASLVVFNMLDFDARLFHHMQLYKFFRVLLFTAPFLWIGLSLIALACGVMAFRHTSKGYRKSLLVVTSLVVLAVAALGVVGHLVRINKAMDGMIRRNVSHELGEFSGPREGRWMRPGDGLIGGEVLSVGKQEFSLRTFRDEEWRIMLDAKTQRNEVEEIIIGDKIGVIGEKTGERLMQAFSIRRFPEDWDGHPPRKMPPHADEESGAVER